MCWLIILVYTTIALLTTLLTRPDIQLLKEILIKKGKVVFFELMVNWLSTVKWHFFDEMKV